MLNYSDPHRNSQRELQTIVREAEYLNKLPAHQLLRLNLAGTVTEFPRESLLLEEGSEITELDLILQGMVAVGLYQEVDPALWLYVSGPGTMVDMCALLDPPVSPVSIRALTDVEVLAIPRAVFLEVMQEEPAMGCEILRSLCSRLSLITNVILKEFSQKPAGPSRN